MCITGTPNWALTVKTTVPTRARPLSDNSQQSDALGPTSPNQKGADMMTPILFAALLTVATPAFTGDWRSIPRTDGVCTLYNENLECVDAARSFLASSTTDGTVA